MKKALLLLLLFSLFHFGFSQNVPKGYKLQTTIRSNTGELLVSKLVAIRISIIQGTSSGNVVYKEVHRTTSNDFGVISLTVGEGIPETNLFKDIDWSNGPYFQKLELDPQNGTNFLFMGTSQIVSVPISLYAQKSGTAVDDLDKDSLNEIQELSMSGDVIKISKSISSLNLEKYIDNTDSQRISLTGKTLSISGGNSIELAGAVDLDSDPLNEVQTLNLTKDTLRISSSNYVLLPNDNDTSSTNEIQSITRKGDTLSISKANSIILPKNLDNDSLNEIQNLVLKSDTISITKGNAIVLPKYDMTPKGAILTLDSLDLSLLQKGYSYIGKQRVTVQNLLSDSAEWQVTQSLISNEIKQGHGSIDAIWTGNQVYLYNVLDPSDNFNGFLKYNPSTRIWTAINENATNSPQKIPALFTTMVWTGSEILIYGGDSFLYRFNPNNETWAKTKGTNNPGLIFGPSGIWTGTEFIIWGGYKSITGLQNRGFKFNPQTNIWTEISTTNAPEGREGHGVFWDGTQMCLFGGQRVFNTINDTLIYKYNPNTNTWSSIVMNFAPSQRFNFATIRIGNEILIFGGLAPNGSGGLMPPNNRLSYNYLTNSWSTLNNITEELIYSDASAVSVGSRVLLFGISSRIEAWELNKQYGVLSPTMVKYLYLFKKN
jgi:hypothetical protein